MQEFWCSTTSDLVIHLLRLRNVIYWQRISKGRGFCKDNKKTIVSTLDWSGLIGVQLAPKMNNFEENWKRGSKLLLLQALSSRWTSPVHPRSSIGEWLLRRETKQNGRRKRSLLPNHRLRWQNEERRNRMGSNRKINTLIWSDFTLVHRLGLFVERMKEENKESMRWKQINWVDYRYP